MAKPRFIEVELNEDGDFALLGYVTKFGALPVVEADVSSISYTITDTTTGSAVSGHSAASAVVADLIYDTLQTSTLDAAWDLTGGYNFRHQLPGSACPGAGPYVYEVFLNLASGAVIIGKYRFKVCPTTRS